MSEDKGSFHFYVNDGQANEVIIRHGQATPIHTPGPIKMQGKFGAPAEFVAKRQNKDLLKLDRFDFGDCNVTFNEKELSITLIAGEQQPDTITIIGALKKNPFLESLGINSASHSNRSLFALVRHKGHLFTSREDHKRLCVSLQNFEVGTKTNLKDNNDRRGNTEVSISQKAESDLAGKEISLYVPLFEGEEPATIKLTLEIEPNNGSVQIFLVSETFEEMWDIAVQAKFQEYRDIFEPFVIVEKN